MDVWALLSFSLISSLIVVLLSLMSFPWTNVRNLHFPRKSFSNVKDENETIRSPGSSTSHDRRWSATNSQLPFQSWSWPSSSPNICTFIEFHIDNFDAVVWPPTSSTNSPFLHMYNSTLHVPSTLMLITYSIHTENTTLTENRSKEFLQS